MSYNLNYMYDIYKNENEKFRIKKSDLIIRNYNFSIAQKEMMKYLTQEEKDLLTEIILNHFNANRQKYRLKQDIFEKFGGKIDNYLFTDLCYTDDIVIEQEIMEEYFFCFDTIESLQELDNILNNEYLKLYPELKKSIRKQLKDDLNL